MNAALLLTLLARAAIRPSAALDLLTLAWAFRRPGSIRLSRVHMDWRRATFGGEEPRPLTAEEVLRFARWRRKMAQLMRG
ncbi:MAG: hypothetical protein HUU25_06635 [Candidatus Sumerlaeia bacterium]|nr:hypothetical protein [Candidatus Sumerlaeia bacterium]